MPPKTAGNMQKQVERDQAPKSILRVDNAHPPGDRFDHVHFVDEGHGKHALYNNGEWKHGGRSLTNAEEEWLIKNEWPLPQ
jgi:hypothetical protein